MSNRLDLDLDEAMPKSGTDLSAEQWDDDLLDGFPDDDPAAQDMATSGSSKHAESGESQVVTRAVKPKKPSKESVPVKADKPVQKPKRPAGHRKKHKTSAWSGISLFVGLLVLLGGLMLGAGVLVATGTTPATVLDFSGLRDLSALGNLNENPVNALWISLAILFLVSILAALGIQRRLMSAQDMTAERDALLTAVKALDPDAPESWRQDVLLADADLATVTGNLLGHYHLQQAKLARYIGLEGELHRLEKAITEDDHAVISADWENPCAGSLADQVMRLIEERNKQASRAEHQHEALESQGPDLVSGLRNARVWQATTFEQVNHQGAAVDRISRQLNKLGANQTQLEDLDRRQERFVQALAAIRDELAALPSRGGREAPDPASLAALTERASRIAFQIAMEVARLGAKGERLLPLTQDLEELTTELRAAIDSSKTHAGDSDVYDRFIETVRGRVVELDPQVIKMSFGAGVAEVLKELCPAASDTSAGMIKLARQFGAQTDRLRELDRLASDLAGLEFEDLDQSMPATESNILVDRYDPFAAGSQAPGGLVADPFTSSSGSGSIFDAANKGDHNFAHQILPGEEDSLLGSSAPEPAVLNLASRDVPSDLGGEPELPKQAEMIYDLREFDAQLLQPDPAHEKPSAKVYELSEFDAVRIA